MKNEEPISRSAFPGTTPGNGTTIMDPTNNYSIRTREWLDETFALTAEDGGYVAHEPIFGFGSRRSAPNHARRMARTARILQLLAGEEFGDFLDVGAGEAYTADLVRECFGVPVAACDLSREACLRGRDLFGVPTFACNAARLPFADQAFDCVLCSEVIEHLEDPFAALAELLRVTRKVLMITTEECCHFELQRRMNLKLRRFSKPHLEINWWTYHDFPALFGPGVRVRRQIRYDGMPSDRETDLARVKHWLRGSIDSVRMEREGFGVVAILRRDPEAVEPRARALDLDSLFDRLLPPRPLGRPVGAEEDAWLRERLRCPICKGALSDCDDGLRCAACDRAWPRYKGLCDLMVDSAGERADTAARRVASGSSSADATAAGTGLDAAHVARLRRLFSPANIWSGKKALAAQGVLGATELVRNLGMGRGVKQSLRAFARCLRDIASEFDPRAEGWLVHATGAKEIYRIERGRKRHIVSEQAFFDLGYVYDQVKEVDAAWLGQFPDGEPLGK